jgi:hypothetical protein
MINPKEHALVFAQKGIGKDWVLYQDGEEVLGLKSVDIYAYCDDATEHRLTFVTGATKDSTNIK